MYVEEVGSLEVVRGKLHNMLASMACCIMLHNATRLAKVDFVEHDLIRVLDSIESRHKRQDSDDSECKFIVPLGNYSIGCPLLCALQDSVDIVTQGFRSRCSASFGPGASRLDGR